MSLSLSSFNPGDAGFLGDLERDENKPWLLLVRPERMREAHVNVTNLLSSIIRISLPTTAQCQ